ncbi:MAG: Cache 3/Cache 2 fusion domain-containing protein, partial [Gammaproteobacteria bacterium]|nr:Cache 3/Cache 2 fusion domain-containing protein [Gammaproteobacteria bacterium]
MMTSLSIKQKLSSLIILVVLATALLIGAYSQHTAKSIIKQRVLNTELPSIVKQINLTIDKQISVMLSLAKEIASDEYILAWNTNKTAQGEALLVKKLARIANENQFSNASFANQQTANYWNQTGFLRQLKNDNVDSWFYRYINGSNTTMSSLYVYPDSNNVDLFVNYKQPSGIGLSGISRSFNDVAAMLDDFKLENTGFVFLTDKHGKVQLHRERGLVNVASLSSLYGPTVAQQLIHTSDFNLSTPTIDGQRYIVASSYIPSMGWYVVAQVPYDEIFALLDKASIKIVIAVILVSLLAMVLALFIGSSVSKPIEKLSQLFTKLGQGEADLNYRIPELG